jgi:hypothetical protein
MSLVKCAIEGCKESFTTGEAVSTAARFICKNHPRSVQLRAVGRSLKKKDNKDATIKFQKHQFDKELRTA